MAKKEKSRAELAAELHFVRRSRNWEVVASVVNNVVRYGTVAWSAYMAYLSVDALSGRRTLAWIGVHFLAQVKVTVVLAWVVGVAGVLYGARQRKLRRDVIARLSGRIQELERSIDSRRTSSKLTVRGETRPEDSI